MADISIHTDGVEIILGNSNKRFSGVTSTMLQVLRYQQKRANVAVLGTHNMPETVHTLSYLRFVWLCRRPLPNGRHRVFHARRNDEMIQALIAKKLFGAKIKIAFTSTAQRQHSGFSRWLMRQMDAIISTCSEAASYLVERPADVIIPHGVDIATFTPALSRALAWQETQLPGRVGIGIFGRVRHSKGVDILVEAVMPLLPKYPDLTVVVCGECAPKDQAFLAELQKTITDAQVSDRFVFLGKQPFSSLPKLFQSMSLVAALSRKEGFGLTPLEAMACGTAVITSEAGAWRDIIRNGIDGFCISTDDVRAVTAKIDLLLGDLESTYAMGEKARAYMVDAYSVEREAERLTDFLRGLAAPSNADAK